MKIKKTEEVVLNALKENKRARKDDFILYGAVLKRLGINLNVSLYTFLSTAKDFFKAPTFETVTRCRRHIQELMPELKDDKTAVFRDEFQDDYKIYNLSGLGEQI